jgi:dihydrofolate reductase
MGHKTWRTLKNPLPNRLNIVLSRQANIETQDSVVVVRDVESVLSMARDLKCDLFVIGGEQVYRSFLPHIERWIVTEVPLTVAGADAFVPPNYLDGFVRTQTKEIGDGLEVSTYSRTPSA